jgi:hypothetical protein
MTNGIAACEVGQHVIALGLERIDPNIQRRSLIQGRNKVF